MVFSVIPPILSRRGNMEGVQLAGDLCCGIAFSRPFKYQTVISRNIFVRLHTPVCAFAVAVRTDNALVLAPAHLRIFGAFCFHGHITAVALADKILKGNINPSGISFEIDGVKIVADRDKPGVIERKHPLDEITGLNAVASKPG